VTSHPERPSLRSATAADESRILDLLQRSGLPTSDLQGARPEFIVAQRAGRIIGIGALERFGTAALLRSLAVEPAWRSTGVGRLIVAELERRARAAGTGELVLLTLTASAFFERLGYQSKPREQVAPAVRESAEFRSLCPMSAACMAKDLCPG